jgi:type I restriction enzyme M protein
MRAKLLGDDKVECVLGLGPNLFYNSPMEACVVICRMNKPLARRNKVLFINAVNEVTRERAQSFLEEDHIQKILEAYQGFNDIDGFARVANTEGILAKQASLNIPLYVRLNGNGNDTNKNDEQSITAVIAEWQQSSLTLRNSMDALFAALEEVGIGN